MDSNGIEVSNHNRFRRQLLIRILKLDQTVEIVYTEEPYIEAKNENYTIKD